jgi:putative ABC transport system permease protein
LAERGPLGKRFKLGGPQSQAPWAIVVGVVQDIRARRIDEPSGGQVYVSMLQSPPRPAALVVQTRGDPRALAETVARAIRAVERDQPVFAVRTMREVLAARLEQRRFMSACLAVFAALALLLAAVGFYGTMSYMIAQRRRELAMRAALGAGPGALTRLVLTHALVLTGAGVLAGLVMALPDRAGSPYTYQRAHLQSQTLSTPRNSQPDWPALRRTSQRAG